MEDYSFDLIRIFLGELPPIIYFEIFIRTAILFFYVILLLRITPQRNIGGLSPIDLLIVIALGAAVGDPMFYPNVPVLHGMAVITIIFLLNYALAKVSFESSNVEAAIQGQPTLLLVDGLLQVQNMSEATVTQDAFFSHIRLNQYDKLGQIKYAYLETNGKISLIPFDESNIISPSLSVLPPRDILELEPLHQNDNTQHDGNYICYTCGYVEDFSQGQRLGICPNCNDDEWYFFKDLENAEKNISKKTQ